MLWAKKAVAARGQRNQESRHPRWKKQRLLQESDLLKGLEELQVQGSRLRFFSQGQVPLVAWEG